MPRIQIPDDERAKLLAHNEASERYRSESEILQERIVRHFGIYEANLPENRAFIATAWHEIESMRPTPNIKSLSDLRRILDWPERQIELGLTENETPEKRSKRYDEALEIWMKLARHLAPSMLEWPENLKPSEGTHRMIATVDDILRQLPEMAAPQNTDRKDSQHMPAGYDKAFTPLEFHDPKDGTFRFDRKLLFELWKALYTTRRRITYDEIGDFVETWKEAMPTDDAIKTAKNDLCKFWRKQNRADLANGITLKARTVGFNR